MLSKEFLDEIIDNPMSTTVYQLATELRDARKQIVELQRLVKRLEKDNK